MNNKGIKDGVKIILSENKKARNSDVELYILYFQRFVCVNFIERFYIRMLFERAWKVCSHLTRERADIQNRLWLYQSDEQIKKLRQAKEEEMRKQYSNR